MEAPISMISAPSKIDINNVNFSKEEFKVKLNEEIHNIMVGYLKDYLVIKVYNKSHLKNNYISFYTNEDLKRISKSMRYFDDINDFSSFIENKGKKNEIFLKKEQNDLFINFKVSSPNGNEEDIFLKLKPKELNDKEIISLLLKKVDI
jgi:hypothetical protein